MTDDDDLDSIPLEDAAIWGGDEALIDLYVVDDEIVGQLPLSRLSVFDPFNKSPWYDGQGFTRELVLKALEENKLHAEPYPGYSWSQESEWTTERHAERVAWLVVHRNTDPIDIEFTDLHSGSMEIHDGWHRLAAAMIRGDTDINIAVGGIFRHAVARLGAICREYQRIADEPTEDYEPSLAYP